jgi:hypothetical protein
MSGALQMLEETGAPAADAFEPEHELIGVGERLRPALQLGIADAGRWDRKLCEYLPDLVERDGVVAVFVGVDPTAIIGSPHRLAWNPGDVEAVGQSCVE